MDDREKLIELIGSTEYGNGSLIGKNFQRGFIEKIADHLVANGVTVQKHGRWIYKPFEVDETLWLCHCSECDVPNANKRNYCPNCGAYMKGKAE